MMSSSKTLLTKVLKNSFDAGVLVDASEHKILYANQPAHDLFGSTSGGADRPSSLVGSNVDSTLSFWTLGTAMAEEKDSLSWLETLNYIHQSDESSSSSLPDEWTITGRKLDGTSFPGALQLTLFDDDNLILLWIRHGDHQDSVKSVASGGQPQFLRRRSSLHAPPTDTETLTVSSDAHQRESILSAVFDASLDPLFQINEHGTIQMVNSAATKLFGWSRTEFLGNNISMICGGNHGPQHHAYLERYLATGETRVIGRKRELPARRKDGSEFPIELGVVECDTFLGDERLFCGFVRDLSSLKQKERLAAEMVEASLDPMFHVNENGTVLMVNQAAVDKFGWSRQELVGKNISVICGGNHAKHHDNYMKHYLATGEKRVIGKNRELPARRKDGTEFWIELAVLELKTNPGEDRMFCGVVHDLSGRKRREDLIRGIIDTALDPLLMINEDGIVELVNDAAEGHLGWTKTELLGSNISIICGGGHAQHHDEYLKRFLKTGVSHIMGQKRELLAKRKDGTQFLMELALCEVKVQDGDKRQFAGFLRDLTKQKHFELEIRRKEQFTSKIIESSPDALFVVDSSGSIVRVNIAAVNKFGWEANDLKGCSVKQVLSKKVGDAVVAEMEAFLSVGVPVTETREGEGLTKEGKSFPVSLHTVEVEGPDNAVFFAIYAEDMTDKKRRMQQRPGILLPVGIRKARA